VRQIRGATARRDAGDHRRPVGVGSRSRVLRPAAAAGLGLADQALLSFTSFWIVLVAARTLDPNAFGWFATVLTSILAANAVHHALVVQPYAVLASDPTHSQHGRLVTSTAVLQAGTVLAVLTATLVASVVLATAAPDRVELVALGGFAAICWQIQELVRRSFYADKRVHLAFRTDTLAYGLQLVGVTTLGAVGLVGGGESIFAFVALAAMLGAAYGARFLDLGRGLVRTIPRATIQKEWEIGKWLVAGALAYILSFHLYFYEVAVRVEPASAGELKLAQVVLAPLNVVFLYTVATLPVALSDALRSGNAIARSILEHLRLTAPLIVAYCGAVIALHGPLERLFGDSYPRDVSTVVGMGVFYLASYVFQIGYCIFTALRRTRVVFLGQAAAATVGLAAGWWLVGAFGVAGAVLGMALGAMMSVVVMAAALVVHARARRTPRSATR
jgi:O-antigen/teichoic acid export membrane protein